MNVEDRKICRNCRHAELVEDEYSSWYRCGREDSSYFSIEVRSDLVQSNECPDFEESVVGTRVVNGREVGYFKKPVSFL